MFLNNDTQVQENWLAPLVELIENDNSIGMVGSKLVYADGKLQEAGEYSGMMPLLGILVTDMIQMNLNITM